jgi:hypothetical protein
MEKRNMKRKMFITMAQNQAGAFHRLALAFLRTGNFLTGRAPAGGGGCGGGAPIVKMAFPLLPVDWVCGTEANGPVGVEGVTPP